jgi:hypothetical protein
MVRDEAPETEGRVDQEGHQEGRVDQEALDQENRDWVAARDWVVRDPARDPGPLGRADPDVSFLRDQSCCPEMFVGR